MKIIKCLVFFILPISSLSQQNQLIPFRKGNLFGFCDQDGKILIKPVFLGAQPFTYDMAVVRIHTTGGNNPDNVKSVFINRKGRMIIKDTFDLAWGFRKMLVETTTGKYKETPIAQVEKQKERYYIDKKGKRILQKVNNLAPMPTTQATEASFPYRLVKREDDKKGIFYNGNILVDPLYDYVSPVDLEKGIFLVVNNDLWGVLNLKNKESLKWHQSVSDGFKKRTKINDSVYCFVTKDEKNKEGIIDENGNIILKHDYNYVTMFDKENKIFTLSVYDSVNSTGLTGLYHLETSLIVEPKYQRIELTEFKHIYKVLLTSKNPYRYREYYINSKGIEFYEE